MTAEDFATFSSKHESFLHKFRMDLEEVKRRKWFRDLQDYQTGFVYAWDMNRNPGALFKRNKKVDIDDATNVAFLGPREIPQNLVNPDGEVDGIDTDQNKKSQTGQRLEDKITTTEKETVEQDPNQETVVNHVMHMLKMVVLGEL